MKITLAGKDYAFDEPFTLGQVRRISTLVSEAIPPDLEQSQQMDIVWNKRINVAIIVLKPIWPDLTPEIFEEQRISNDELVRAYLEIIKHAGLVRVEDGAQGEVVAEVA